MRNFISILFVLIAMSISAQNQLESKITKATVYKNNAKLTSEAGGKLPAGTSEIVIRNIPTTINPSSLQVALKTIGKVSLLSAVYENDYLNQNSLNDKQKQLKAELDKLNDDLNWIKEQKQIYTDLESVLNDNKKLGGANVGLEPTDLSQLLDVYKTKQFEYNKEYLSLQKQEKDLTEQRNNIQNQLNEENAKFNKPSGVIKLQVSALSPVYTDFKLDYLIYNAGWTPIYDLRSEGTDKPVDLIYKANIYQNSGYDWERVDLTVSTGNPSQNNNRPVLNPLYANYYEPYYGSGNVEINEVQVRAYKVEKNMAYADVVAQEASFDEGFAYNAQEQNSTFSTQYEVALPQSIPSDGKEHLVGLTTYQLNSVYQYHSVPKLDKGVFLLAKVSNWGQYNLLPGKSNIFFEGAYVGESTINPNVSNDTLLLSLGRDEGIKIERTELKDFTKTKILGANKVETYTYEIEIRNNKNKSVEIEVLDQIPVSQQKDIVVTLDEGGGATYNSEYGKLEWKINLAANQSKKVRFTYSIKYPKDKVISGKK
ncbi:MAG: mucoidy inhibitor MuiA family protein [Chitinophagales bacterium]